MTTTTTATRTAKAHRDGGTFDVIQFAPTSNDSGVAVVRRTGYRGNTWFEAARCIGDAMMPIVRDASEAVVRRAANAEWLAQRVGTA